MTCQVGKAKWKDFHRKMATVNAQAVLLRRDTEEMLLEADCFSNISCVPFGAATGLWLESHEGAYSYSWRSTVRPRRSAADDGVVRVVAGGDHPAGARVALERDVHRAGGDAGGAGGDDQVRVGAREDGVVVDVLVRERVVVGVDRHRVAGAVVVHDAHDRETVLAAGDRVRGDLGHDDGVGGLALAGGGGGRGGEAEDGDDRDEQSGEGTVDGGLELHGEPVFLQLVAADRRVLLPARTSQLGDESTVHITINGQFVSQPDRKYQT